MILFNVLIFNTYNLGINTMQVLGNTRYLLVVVFEVSDELILGADVLFTTAVYWLVCRSGICTVGSRGPSALM